MTIIRFVIVEYTARKHHNIIQCEVPDVTFSPRVSVNRMCTPSVLDFRTSHSNRLNRKAQQSVNSVLKSVGRIHVIGLQRSKHCRLDLRKRGYLVKLQRFRRLIAHQNKTKKGALIFYRFCKQNKRCNSVR